MKSELLISDGAQSGGRAGARGEGDGPAYAWDAFVSYARADKTFVVPIVERLEAAGWSIWVDQDELAAGTRLTQELPSGVRDAHTLILMMSPQSVASSWCMDEVDAAIALGRRIIPVVLDLDTKAPPQLDDYLRLTPTDPRDAVSLAEQLSQLLSHDLEWVRGHRLWSSEAARWDDAGRPRGLLLGGHRLELAEAWQAGQGSRAQPRVTETLAQFLAASRESETRRLRRQRLAISIAAAVLAVFGAGALVFGLIARDRAATARSRELAAQADATLPFDPAQSWLLAERAVRWKDTVEAAAALQEATLQDRLLARIHAGGVGPDPPGLNAVAYTPDGRLVITGGDNGRIGLWDGRSGATRGAAQSAQEVRSLHLDHGGGRLIVGTSSALELWDLACIERGGGGRCLRREAAAGSGQDAAGAGIVSVTADSESRRLVSFVAGGRAAVLWTGSLHRIATLRTRSPVTAVAISARGDRVATGLRDGSVLVWSARGRALAEGPHHRLAVTALAFGPRGTLASGSGDGTVRLWSPDASPTTRHVGDLPGQVLQLAVSRAGYVAVGGESGVIFEWRLGSGRFIGALAGHTGIVSALRYGRDGKRLYSASDEGTLRVWDSATGGTRAVMAGHRGRVQAIAISPAGDRAASVSADGELRIWNARRDTSDVELVGHRRAIPTIAYSVGGSRILTSSIDGTARLWRAASGKLIRAVRVGTPLEAARFGPSGSIIVTGWNGAVSRWDPITRRRIWRAPACTHPPCGKAYALAVSPRHDLVAAGSTNGGDLRDAETGHLIRPIQPNAYVFTLQFDASGTHVLSAGTNGRAILTPTKAGKPLTFAQPGGGWVYEARIAPDGRTVLTVGDGACVWVAQASPRCKRLRLPNGAGRLYTGDIQTRPFRAVVAGSSGTVFVFDSPDAKPLRLEGHTGAIERVRLTADGRRVISIGQDATARVWSATSGAHIARFTGATTGLLDLALDPRSPRVAVASNDGSARIYAWR